MSLVLIRQIPDDYAEAVGLAKHNRSRMPGCKDEFYAAVNLDGRAVTGLDDEVVIIKEEKEKVKTLRTRIETVIKKDLSATSDFWQTFKVIIDTNKPKTFDKSNALDLLSLTMLVANAYVAPDKEAASTFAYKDCQYYAYTEENEAKEEMSTRKTRDAAIGELQKISDSKEKMQLYGQYLEGFKYHDKISTDMMYKMLRAYIEDAKFDNTKNFIEALKTPVEEIQRKIIIDKAIKTRIIKQVNINGKNSAFQYGQVTLGANMVELYANLALPDFAPELYAITQQLS